MATIWAAAKSDDRHVGVAHEDGVNARIAVVPLVLAGALVVACQSSSSALSATPATPTAVPSARVVPSPSAGTAPAARRRIADIPTPRSEVAAVVSQQQGKVFVIGGQGGPERVELYDAASDRWERAPDLPIGVDHAMAAAAEGSRARRRRACSCSVAISRAGARPPARSA